MVPKAHKPQEFAVKVSVTVTHKEGYLVGILAFPNNPHDDHTLASQLGQVERLTGKVPDMAFVDRGNKGQKLASPDRRPCRMD